MVVVKPGSPNVKAAKIIITILVLVYITLVVVFESLLGYYQPESPDTLVITTTDEDGTTNDRVLARLQSNGQLYVAVNHWPRAWYNQTLDNPNVQITYGGEKKDYLAVTVTDDEHDRVNSENNLGTMFKILTGFPPRYIVRLDPR